MEKFIGQIVIARTYSAGVHVGTLMERDGMVVVLSQTRRIWYWEKAFTLSAIAMHGVGKKSKLSVVIPEILLTQVIELIPCTEEAAANLFALAAHE